MIPATITPTSITFMLDNRHRHVAKSHANFEAVKRQLRIIQSNKVTVEDMDVLRGLVDIPTFIATITEGRIQASPTEVRFDGKPMHGHAAERLLMMLNEGFDIRPLMKFLDRLSKNPVPTAADELLRWLEASKLPITSDGCFIAYKFVDADYKDCHTHRIDNRVGALIPRLDPSRVNTNRHQTCAESGYHFCSFNYLGGSNPHVMLVEISPEDVSSFPYEENTAKGRCMFYRIIGEVPQDELAKRQVEERPVYAGMHASDPSPYQNDLDEEDEVDEDQDGDEDTGEATVCQCHGLECDPSDPNAVKVSELPKALAADFVSVGGGKDVLSLGEKITRDAARPTGRSLWLERLKGVVYDEQKLTPKRLMKLIKKHGQREVSRRTGIPRSTLQGWLE